MSRDNETERWAGYLPIPCPCCGRQRLETYTNAEGNVCRVHCEKCERDSRDDVWNFDEAHARA